jgi:glutaredoxin
LTTEGFRPYPREAEILAFLQGEAIPAPKFIESGMVRNDPTLVTAEWCPFTVGVTRMWSDAAEEAGITLSTLDAESPEGEQAMAEAGVSGVPCLVTSDGNAFYGREISPSEAKALLLGPE